MSAWRSPVVAALVGALVVAATAAPVAAHAQAVPPDVQPPYESTPRYVIERIDIHGNSRTHADTIRSHLLVAAGQVLDEEKVTLSKLKLLTLPLFLDVKTRLSRGTMRGAVVLHFEVLERNSIVIEELFLGSSARTPYWGGFGLSDMNFLGRGHTLHGAFVVSGHQQAYRLDYFAPSIPGSALTLGGGLLYSKGLEFFPVLLGSAPVSSPDTDASGLVDYERWGGYLSAGFKVGPFNRFFVDLRAEALRGFVGAGLGQLPIARGQSRLITLSGFFERDARDRAFVPTSGHRLRLGVEVGSELVGGQYNFSKYTFQYEQALPTFREHSFKLDLKVGLIQGDAPFFTKFFFGDTSFFSFRDRALPRALGLNFSKETVYDDVLFSAGLEYAYPFLAKQGPVYRSYLFAAANTTFTSTVDELMGRRSRAFGGPWTVSFDLGIKLDTTIGMFTFSVAYLLDFFL